MRRLLPVLLGTLALAASLVLLAAAQAEAPAVADPPDGEPRPVHLDVRAIEDGVVKATLGYLREDPAEIREGLERIEASTRRLDREADETLGSDLIVYEQAFHVTLDRSREFVNRGDLENSFTQFVWLERACITCHGLARERGLLPAAGSASDR